MSLCSMNRICLFWRCSRSYLTPRHNWTRDSSLRCTAFGTSENHHEVVICLGHIIDIPLLDGGKPRVFCIHESMRRNVAVASSACILMTHSSVDRPDVGQETKQLLIRQITARANLPGMKQEKRENEWVEKVIFFSAG